MYFDSFSAALAMEGHGPFVWGAYLICILVVTAILLGPARRKRRFLRRLAGELKRQQGGPKAMNEAK